MSNKNELKILLIDNDEDYLTIVSDMLCEIKELDFKLFKASTYLEGKKHFIENKFDLYLIDYQIDEEKGLELIVEATYLNVKAPIIMLTALKKHEIGLMAIKSGASDYLIKEELAPSILERSIHYSIERKRSETMLKDSREYFESIIKSSIDMIIATDISHNITEFNPVAEKVFGYTRNTVIGKPFTLLFAETSKCEQICFMIEKNKTFHGEILTKRQNGSTFPAYISASLHCDTNGKSIGIIIIARDVTEQRKIKEKLIHNTLHDSLTGLPNRVLFEERLKLSLDIYKRNKSVNFATFLIDLDRFKIINDSLGHAAGDTLLIEVSKRLKNTLRSTDTIARLGGDEFAVLVNNADNEPYIKIIAEKIMDCFKEKFTITKQPVFITASIGITTSRRGYNNTEDILRDADTVMYKAKTMGKARYKIFDSHMHQEVVSFMQIERDLRSAVLNDELRIYYQPIISFKTGMVSSLEALVRWQHPEKGLILPIKFIPVAEETKLIILLGEKVMKRACEDYQIWKNKGFDLKLCVNFSTLQFQSYTLIDYLKKTLKESSLNPKKFVMEITESTMMEKSGYSINILNEMKKIGINIALDDFGTGYSALSSLQHFPIDDIKIDMSLVREISIDKNARTITTALITLAHNLNLNVVAEGIETKEQFNFLKDNGCDEMQGYLFSPPVTLEELLPLLSKKIT